MCRQRISSTMYILRVSYQDVDHFATEETLFGVLDI